MTKLYAFALTIALVLAGTTAYAAPQQANQAQRNYAQATTPDQTADQGAASTDSNKKDSMMMKSGKDDKSSTSTSSSSPSSN